MRCGTLCVLMCPLTRLTVCGLVHGGDTDCALPMIPLESSTPSSGQDRPSVGHLPAPYWQWRSGSGSQWLSLSHSAVSWQWPGSCLCEASACWWWVLHRLTAGRLPPHSQEPYLGRREPWAAGAHTLQVTGSPQWAAYPGGPSDRTAASPQSRVL